MRRREFIAVLAAAAARPVVARAQTVERKRRVGVLMSYAADDPEARLRIRALESRLRELGWPGGKLEIDYRFASGGDPRVLQAQAGELVALEPDLLLAQSTPVLVAVRRVSGAIPLVFVQVTDPVGAGFVRSLAQPGGHLTGFTDFEYDIGGKWIALLEEVSPAVSGVVVVLMAGHAGNAGIFRAMQGVAARMGIRLFKVEATAGSEIALDPAIAAAANGLIVLPSPVAVGHREALIALAARHRLPSVFPYGYFAHSGGLMAYGIDQVDQWSQAAAYIDRILRGANPADLPVQQPSKFELVVNVKTANALGLELPPTLLARADEVIE